MFNKRELLDTKVEKTTPLKEFIVDYVGGKTQPTNFEVTVEMVINVLADDFPRNNPCFGGKKIFLGDIAKD